MSALADFSKRWHMVLRCTICGPLGLLFKQVYVLCQRNLVTQLCAFLQYTFQSTYYLKHAVAWMVACRTCYRKVSCLWTMSWCSSDYKEVQIGPACSRTPVGNGVGVQKQAKIWNLDDYITHHTTTTTNYHHVGIVDSILCLGAATSILNVWYPFK